MFFKEGEFWVEFGGDNSWVIEKRKEKEVLSWGSNKKCSWSEFVV